MFLLLILLFSCNLIPKPDDSSIKGIYSIQSNGLYYSSFDSLGFEFIPRLSGLKTLHYNKRHDLFLAASYNKLYFVNPNTNEKINEIDIPINPKADYHSMMPSSVYIYPHPTNDDYCILCNWSIYLINLNTFSIEEVLWDLFEVQDENNIVLYMHYATQSSNLSNLFLQFTVRGSFPIGGDLAINGLKNHLMGYDILQDSMYSIIDYPLENGGSPGSKFIYCSEDYVFACDPNENPNLIRIPISDMSDISKRDTISTSIHFFPNTFTTNDFIFAQDFYTGDFYKIYTNGEICQYMELGYDRTELVYEDTILYGPAVFNASYQEFEGGDVYACVPLTSDTTALIINLTRKKIIKEFYRNSASPLFIMEIEE